MGTQDADDFAQYLLTDDAKLAEDWQLEVLAKMGRRLGQYVSPKRYIAMRKVLVEEAAERTNSSSPSTPSAAATGS